MSEMELAKEILHQILHAIRIVARRFAPIASAEDFTSSEAGLEKLDAICMQLIAIGESIKRLDRITEGKLLVQYPQVEWKRVMGMRDMLTHHYFDLMLRWCIQSVHITSEYLSGPLRQCSPI